MNQALVAWSFRQSEPAMSEMATQTHRGHRLDLSANIKVDRKNLEFSRAVIYCLWIIGDCVPVLAVLQG